MSRFDKVIAEQRQVRQTIQDQGLLESQIQQKRVELEAQCLKEIEDQLPEFQAVFPEIEHWDEMYLCYKTLFGGLKQKQVKAIGFINLNTRGFDLNYYPAWQMLEDGSCYHLTNVPQDGYDDIRASQSLSFEDMVKMICRCLPWIMYDGNYRKTLEKNLRTQEEIKECLKDRYYRSSVCNDAKVDILAEMFMGNAEEAVFRYFSLLLNGRI